MYSTFPQFSETTDESCSHLQRTLHIKVQDSFESVMIVGEQILTASKQLQL